MPKEYAGMPEPPAIAKMRIKANASYANKLTDAEIDDVENLFKTEDSKGTGKMTIDGFKAVMKKLQNDDCNIGKVPVLKTEEAINEFLAKITKKEDEEEEETKDIVWEKAIKHINDIEWQFLDENELKVRVDKLYAEVRCISIKCIGKNTNDAKKKG